MSQLEVNKINPATGTDLAVGDSGDTITVPSGATLDIAGTISNSGTATGFGAIEWQTGSIKTATFSAVAGKGYFCNTTSGEFNATLPSSPSAGDQIGIADYAGTFDTNALSIDPNTKKIEGSTDPQGLTAERQSVIIVYVDATQGWIVTEAGDSTTISPAVITFTTTAGSIGTILDSQRASGYSLSAVTATVTFGSLTYSISSGSLPGGLSMDSAGAITGTATAVGSDTVSTFTVLATASGGATASREFTIQVDDPIITFTTAAGTLGTIADDERSSYTLSAATATATSGTVSYALQSGAMPTGLSFNTTTAAITGTATAVGTDTTTNFTVRATTTSASEYLDRAFSILVEAPLPYVEATGPDGAAGTTDGDYKYHVFNSSKTGSNGFAVSNAGGVSGSNTVEYVVVAGGGGGGKSRAAGAGAGGMRTATGLSVTVQNYDIVVGGGGSGSSMPNAIGGVGSTSSGIGISTVGGGGGAGAGVSPGASGRDGGSGGGTTVDNPSDQGSGTAGEGNDGGTGGGSPKYGAGGGGGKGAVGQDGSTSNGGNGGAGQNSSITSSAVGYAGGGGGGTYDGGPAGTASHGGGAGGSTSNGTAGTSNRGGGGGGGGYDGGTAKSGGNGGSGVVIIRYKFQN
jgi:hypothetical protein